MVSWSCSCSLPIPAPPWDVTSVTQDTTSTATIWPWKNHIKQKYRSANRIKPNVCRKLVNTSAMLSGFFFFLSFFTIPVLDRNEGEVVVFRHCSHKLFDSKCNDDQVRLAWGRSRDSPEPLLMQDSCHWYCQTDLCNIGLNGKMPINSKAMSGRSMFGGFQGYFTLILSVFGLLYNHY